MERTIATKELLFEALDQTRAGVLITDPQLEDNPIIYANYGFYDMTGYDSGEIIGQNCRFLQGEDTDKHQVHALKQAIEANASITVTLYNYKKCGKGFWNSLTVDHLYIEAEEKHYFIGVQKDVTIEKNLEASLKEAQKEVQTLACPIVPLTKGVAVLPLIGTMSQERFMNILTCTTEEIVSKRLQTIIVDLSGVVTFNELLLPDLVRLRDVIKLQGAELYVTGMSSELILNTLDSKQYSRTNLQTASTVQDILEKLNKSS
ncbi:PAS domain-containing protein [Alkalicoccobacillus porphyridii]|uniref:PAS domain-containing protein n=1 Tax=Alkalicoccobacillus porphyridii TaxID=2597270 RepID=A0A554A258_9BACI|nr:STAS domain-containing protein [Alkalicoccobacillus porphyridii]TSB47784.1 PAS domain-containing protein [Alkalicoccobacillus porphyridii]